MLSPFRRGRVTAAELHWAVATHDVEGLRAILSRGVSTEALGALDARGRTVLHVAVEGGGPGLVGILLEAGADASHADDCGRQPLHVVRDEESVELLVRAQADPSARDKSDVDPLQAAHADGRIDAARALARALVDPRAAAHIPRLQASTADTPGLLLATVTGLVGLAADSLLDHASGRIPSLHVLMRPVGGPETAVLSGPVAVADGHSEQRLVIALAGRGGGRAAEAAPGADDAKPRWAGVPEPSASAGGGHGDVRLALVAYRGPGMRTSVQPLPDLVDAWQPAGGVGPQWAPHALPPPAQADADGDADDGDWLVIARGAIAGSQLCSGASLTETCMLHGCGGLRVRVGIRLRLEVHRFCTTRSADQLDDLGFARDGSAGPRYMPDSHALALWAGAQSLRGPAQDRAKAWRHLHRRLAAPPLSTGKASGGMPALISALVPGRKPEPPPRKLPRPAPGIPTPYRAQLWWLMLGGRDIREPGAYRHLCARAAGGEVPEATARQIDLDLSRTFSDHPLFNDTHDAPAAAEADATSILVQEAREALSTRRGALRRVLRAYSVRNISVGYCQAVNYIVGALLLHMTEEDAFYTLCAICEVLLPDYFSEAMSGLITDCNLVSTILRRLYPALAKRISAAGPMLPLVPLLARWFLALFLNALSPVRDALVIIDLIALEGPAVLVAAGVGVLRSRSAQLHALPEEASGLAFERPPTLSEVLPAITCSGLKARELAEAKRLHPRAHEERRVAQLDELKKATKLNQRTLRRVMASLRTRLACGDGAQDLYVSPAAFADILRAEEPTCTIPEPLLWATFDANNDGQLDVRELLVGLALLRRTGPGPEDDVLFECFKAFDRDGSGVLEREEVVHLFARIYRFVGLGDMEGEQASAPSAQVKEPGGIRREDRLAAEYITSQAFRRFDLDRDGTLSFGEFREVVAGDFLLNSWFQLRATARRSHAAPA